MGSYLSSRLAKLFESYLPDNLGEVRGKGLMIGVELVDNKTNKTPATMLGKKIIIEARKQGIILVSAWDWHILVFLPPLTISKDEIDHGLQILEQVLKTVARK